MNKKWFTALILSIAMLVQSLISGVDVAKATSKTDTKNEINYSKSDKERERILQNTQAIKDLKNSSQKELLDRASTSATADNSTSNDQQSNEDDSTDNSTSDEESSEDESTDDNVSNKPPQNEEVDQSKPNNNEKNNNEKNNKKNNKKPSHIYYKKKNEKKVNYFLQVKTIQKKNYPIYKNNPYNVDAKSLKPSYFSFNYKSKEVFVSRTAKVNGKIWFRISYKGKYLGWIEGNGLSSNYKKLNVKVINQRPELPTGCEITAVTMMLQYAGTKVNKIQLAEEMPRTATLDGNLGFVGNPYKTTGWWIFPPALMNLVKKHAGTSINMTGVSFTSIKKQINRNHPVVVWVAGVDGFINHALTITGYSSTRAYYNDPWTGKKSSMSIKALEQHRKDDKYRTISY
ncbi:C39 family peptidase [Rummeliibacillus sp. NPDC094406]|uniref:C39 family peptidase n=1 Tax=Rummeliibacillus sp. NPDC094406 TaxID=3364511 RepID=UPI0037F599C4